MAQQQQQFRGEPREKNALDDPKLKIYGDPINGAKGAPVMHFYYTGQNPRIAVWTNLPGDEEDGKIQAGLDQYAVGEIFVMLEDLCKPETPNGTQWVMDNKRKGKDGGEMFVDTHLSIGKDKDGKIYMRLLSRKQSRPKVTFYFGQGLYHTVSRVVNGEKVADAPEAISRRRCLSFLDRNRGLLSAVAAKAYKHPEPQDRTGGNNRGGGGGYNRGGGNSYGGGNNSGGARRGGGGGDDNEFEAVAAGKPAGDAFDDDIPFNAGAHENLEKKHASHAGF